MPYKDIKDSDDKTRIPSVRADDAKPAGKFDLDPMEGDCYEGVQKQMEILSEALRDADNLERKAIVQHMQFLMSFSQELKTMLDIVENAKAQVKHISRGE